MVLLFSFYALNVTETNSTDTTLLWHAMRTCALIDYEPFYDCSKHWIITWSYEAKTVKPHNGDTVLGFAFFDLNQKWDKKISVCAYFPLIIEKQKEACWDDWIMIGNSMFDGCYEGKCNTLLWHELKHLLCYCNWHKDMTPAYKIKLNG